MQKILGLVICALLAGCMEAKKTVIRGPSPGVDYRNQDTAPWPWVSVVPSPRALDLKNVDFESISRQFHYDMAFDPQSPAFKNVRVILLDYTILPSEIKKDKDTLGKDQGGPHKNQTGVRRPERYFLVASFYRMDKRPPCPPDWEIATTLRSDKAGRQEAMRLMTRVVVQESYVLYKNGMLTPGKKIMINLD